MKVKSAAGSSCYVMILNHTYNALPQALLNATQPVSKRTVLLQLQEEKARKRCCEFGPEVQR